MDNNPLTKQFLRYQAALKDLEQQSKGSKPIRITAVAKHHGVSTSIGSFLTELKYADIILAGSRRDGRFMEFKQPVDTKMVQAVIEKYSQRNKESGIAYRNKKQASSGTITSAVRTSKKYNLDNVGFLVEYLQEKVKKNVAAPGYLRPDEEKFFPQVIQALTVISTLGTELPKVIETLTKLQNKIS